MPAPLGELRQNVGLPQQRSVLRGQALTPSKRRPVGKQDLVDLLSTARLADLRNELKAISPASTGPRNNSSSETGTPTSHVVASKSDVHASGACLDSAESRCKSVLPHFGQVDLFGNAQDVSPTTLMQLEINRKRDMLFKPYIGNRGKLVKRSSKDASRRTSRASSRPASRRESFAIQQQGRSEELDQGESAGALRFRELQTQLHGHTHIPKTGTTPASPASLWYSSGFSQGSLVCAEHSQTVGAQVTAPQNLSMDQGVVISVAPQARTPEYFVPASDDALLTRQRTPIISSQTYLPATPEGTLPGFSSDVSASPLTDFITLFQATQDREVGRLALRLWRRKAAASCHMREGEPVSHALESVSIAINRNGGVDLQLEADARGWVTPCSDGPCAALPSSSNDSIRNHCHEGVWVPLWNGIWTWIATLILRRALRDWLLVARARVRERVTVERFIRRSDHRVHYVSFHRWCSACGLV